MWSQNRVIKGLMIVGCGLSLVGGCFGKKPKLRDEMQTQIEDPAFTAEENLAAFDENTEKSMVKVPQKKETYYFNLNSDVLNNQAKSELQRIAQYFKKNPELVIRLDGHADAQGPSTFNEQLSEQRANSVKYYLEQHGIDPAQMEVYGHSNRELVDLRHTEAAHAKNRRVELSYH